MRLKIYYREFFGQFDIVVMSVLAFVALAVAGPAWAQGAAWLWLLAGAVLYLMSEYFTHRFFFHMKPPKNAFLLKMVKRLHYDHHVVPNDLHLLFLPVWYSLPQMIAAALVSYWLAGTVPLAAAFFAGNLLTLLVYEWTHYVAHRPITPWTRFGKWMKKIHLWHHYKSEHYWFGVTNPLLDVLLGTFPPEKSVERSETARNLEAQG
ncbi:sterol desaturase family protein [Tumebacillus sp. DT12]|uniref:Sterol desaturase family protein n=1 Tax=Tumebacillus lacus TaxID=2995335 RepID=A0ABT3X196_9BACL|nr:sterol desaturase family protein [Tumebacillus lacus]MCX7570221.1 sterol desaturase family protein [Tumebacillus lacus]